MARLSIDESILSDPRILRLSDIRNENIAFTRNYLIMLWFFCYRNIKDTLTCEDVASATGLFNDAILFCDQMASVHLAEKVEGGYRIRGVRDRIEYLRKASASGRIGGMKSAHIRNEKRTNTLPSPSPTNQVEVDEGFVKGTLEKNEGSGKGTLANSIPIPIPIPIPTPTPIPSAILALDISSTNSSTRNISAENTENKEIKSINNIPPIVSADVAAETPGKTSAHLELTRKTWEAYSKAYEHRYKTPPVRNAKQNSLIKKLCERLGQDAPLDITHYVFSSSKWYVMKGHALDVALADAEKIRTERLNGTVMTDTKARSMDSRSSLLTEMNKHLEKRGLK